MNQPAPTWTVRAEIPGVILAPRNLRRTAAVALVVGTVFFWLNQLGVILAGAATTAVWAKAVMTYLTPLAVSNYGVVSATRRCVAPAQAAHQDSGARS